MSTKQIEWTTRDIECAKQVLALSFEASEALPTLTDEEIVALDGIDRDQFVALPFLEKHEENKYLAATVALRSLISKGIAFPVIEKGNEEPTRLNATEHVTGIMTLRRTAQRIVTGQRTSDVGRHWLFTYVHDDVVLEEEVNDGGIHAFVVYPADRLAHRLSVLGDPRNVAGSDGEPTVLNQAEFEDRGVSLLSESRAVTIYTGASGGPETFTNLTVYTGADSVQVLSATNQSGSAQFSIAEVSADTLTRRLQEELVNTASSNG